MSAQIPIIGMGDIQNAADVIEFMVAGAIAVAGHGEFLRTADGAAGHRRYSRIHGAKDQRRARDQRQRPDGEVRFTA